MKRKGKFASAARSYAGALLPPIVSNALRRAKPPATGPGADAEVLELERLRNLPAGTPTVTEILGWPFHVTDGASFAHLYHVFFQEKVYGFAQTDRKPYIIDCGANIGVSVAWWKKMNPDARVLAFEADPDIFQLLQKNCGHLPDVKLVNAAVWDREGKVSFAAKGGEGGHLGVYSEQTKADQLREVPGVRLGPYLDEKCDFLKMDIEGAEVEVLRDCAGKLGKVARMFVEYHSFTRRKQNLGETLKIIEDAGFRVHVHHELPSPRPFLELLELNEKDLRLDLFCHRPESAPAVKVL